MENKEVNPNNIIRPRSNSEKIASFFNIGLVTRDLVSRLIELDTTITSPDGQKEEITMDDVKKYVEREAKRNLSFYPPGARYNSVIEAGRKRASLMERELKNGNYGALIKPILELAVKQWNTADRLDAVANMMSTAERMKAEEIYNESVNAEQEISAREAKTGKKEEHGFPPELLAIGGKKERLKSQVFLTYAVVLAKNI